MGESDRDRRLRRMSFSVFVGHVPKNVTRQMILQLFSSCGNIVDTFINPSDESLAYTYSFVRYSKYEEAKKAVEQLDGWPLLGEKIRVEISRETKEKVYEKKDEEKRQDMLHLAKLRKAFTIMSAEESDPRTFTDLLEKIKVQQNGKVDPFPVEIKPFDATVVLESMKD